MPPLAERQRGFATAILTAGASPAGLLGPDGTPSDRRFAVYRNNVTVGLSEALTAAFPAVCRIVGEAFFRGMARQFIFADGFSVAAGPADFFGEGERMFHGAIADDEPAAARQFAHAKGDGPGRTAGAQ